MECAKVVRCSNRPAEQKSRDLTGADGVFVRVRSRRIICSQIEEHLRGTQRAILVPTQCPLWDFSAMV